MRRRTRKGGHGRHHHVITVEIARDLFVHGVLDDKNLGTLVKRTGRDESSGHHALRIIREQNIAGQLFLHTFLRKADFERFLAANPDAKAEINRIVETRLSVNQEDGDRATESVSN